MEVLGFIMGYVTRAPTNVGHAATAMSCLNDDGKTYTWYLYDPGSGQTFPLNRYEEMFETFFKIDMSSANAWRPHLLSVTCVVMNKKMADKYSIVTSQPQNLAETVQELNRHSNTRG